jgi:hypothetical protein
MGEIDMDEWQSIKTAPHDGSVVWVKRVFNGRLVAEGEAVFDLLDSAAPSLRGVGPDPLGRLSAADYARENNERALWAGQRMWLRPDRLYRFPTPTHWKQR